MDITNIFCQSLGVTSHVKKFLTVCRFRTNLVSFWTAQGIPSKKIVICANDLGYLFGKNCHLFERLGLSIWKKLSSVQMAWDIHFKKLLSVLMARAIRSKKNLSTVRATEAICSQIHFSRVSIPKPFRSWPLASNDLLLYRSRMLQILFTNVTYMNSYASLLLCSHLRCHTGHFYARDIKVVWDV